jgi:hypothetical protein
MAGQYARHFEGRDPALVVQGDDSGTRQVPRRRVANRAQHGERYARRYCHFRNLPTLQIDRASPR